MLVNAFMQDELAQTHNDINLAQLQMGITTLIAIIAGVLIAWRITLQITRPLHSTLAMAERIAGGDLRQAQTSTRRDELGQLLNAVAAMSQNLRTMIEKIQMGVSRSPPPRRKSPPATPTSPHAPNSRRRRSRKPPPAWNS